MLRIRRGIVTMGALPLFLCVLATSSLSVRVLTQTQRKPSQVPPNTPANDTDARYIFLGPRHVIVRSKQGETLLATLSYDQTKLLYYLGSGGNGVFTILNADSFAIERRVPLHSPNSLIALALSPDGHGIVFSDTNRLYFIDIDKPNPAELPGTVSSYKIAWPKANVLWVYDRRNEDFNLDTLKYTDDPSISTWLAQSAQCTNTKAFMEWRGWMGTDELSIVSRDGSFRRRLLSLEGASTDNWHIRNDLHYILSVDYDAFGTQQTFLTVTTLEAHPHAATFFQYRSNVFAQSANSPNVYAKIYAPKVNPINHKVVGPSSEFKADARIGSLGDGKWTADVTYEVSPVNVGDVIVGSSVDTWAVLEDLVKAESSVDAEGTGFLGRWDGCYTHYRSVTDSATGKVTDIPFEDCATGPKVSITKQGNTYQITVFDNGYDWTANMFEIITASLEDGQLIGKEHYFHADSGFTTPEKVYYSGAVPTIQPQPDGSLKVNLASGLATLRRHKE